MGNFDRPRSGGSGGFRSGGRDGGRGGGGGRFNRGPRRDFGGPREMHKTKCSECGQDCEVPFKPTEGKPVYCRDCFQKKNPNPRRF